MLYAISKVKVALVFRPALSMMTVSCASGKLAADAEPPLELDQILPLQLLDAVDAAMYLFAPATKVMLVLPKQLPRRVPDQGDDAPATAMSRKSTSVSAATVPTVNVLGVPIVSERTKYLLTEDCPAMVNVPVTV